MRLQALALLACLSACGGEGHFRHHMAADPGDTAAYDMARDRTSNLIRSADAAATIVQPSAIGYVVALEYEIKIPFATETGVIQVDIEREFFTEEYRIGLRQDGTRQHEEFTITHRGYDGRCDEVTLTNLGDTGDLDDAEVDARICPGIPVLGAETIDIRGKYQGQRVKLGLDWEGL